MGKTSVSAIIQGHLRFYSACYRCAEVMQRKCFGFLLDWSGFFPNASLFQSLF